MSDELKKVFDTLLSQATVAERSCVSDYKKNIEVMAYSLAQMMAPIVVLSEDDSFDAQTLASDVRSKVILMMEDDYRNEVEVDPHFAREHGIEWAYECALFNEFDRSISDSCEQWIRRLQKDDKGE